MAIVHVGSLCLEVKGCESERRFKERLIAQRERWVHHVVARCTEEALDGKVTELLGRAVMSRHAGMTAHSGLHRMR